MCNGILHSNVTQCASLFVESYIYKVPNYQRKTNHIYTPVSPACVFDLDSKKAYANQKKKEILIESSGSSANKHKAPEKSQEHILYDRPRKVEEPASWIIDFVLLFFARTKTVLML